MKHLILYEDHNVDSLLRDINILGISDERVIIKAVPREDREDREDFGSYGHKEFHIIVESPDVNKISQSDIYKKIKAGKFEVEFPNIKNNDPRNSLKRIVRTSILNKISGKAVNNMEELLVNIALSANHLDRQVELIIDGKIEAVINRETVTIKQRDYFDSLSYKTIKKYEVTGEE